jgi:hypothetical protein
VGMVDDLDLSVRRFHPSSTSDPLQRSYVQHPPVHVHYCFSYFLHLVCSAFTLL